MLTVGSLFAGIGGFDLGLERAGMRSVWQSDVDPFCLAVLEKHWPDVLRVPDIRDVGADTVPDVDVICGGFPCQDLSYAGAGAGITGARSGLWSEYARVIGELRPRYVVVENVSALLARGLGVVLGDLAALGYDAEWDCLPASAFGAPHRRDRIWLVAYPNSEGEPGRPVDAQQGPRIMVSDTQSAGLERVGLRGRPAVNRADVADSSSERRGSLGPRKAQAGADALGRHGGEPAGDNPWAVEPDVGRVADGVPARVDRLRALGNSLVPQIAEWIGRRIVAHEEGQLADAA